MKLNPICMACQLRKQEAKIRHFDERYNPRQNDEIIGGSAGRQPQKESETRRRGACGPEQDRKF